MNLHPGVGDSVAEQSVFITLEFIIPEKVTCSAIQGLNLAFVAIISVE